MTLTALASNPPASAPATPPASAPAKPTPAAQAAASSVTLSPAVKQATRETGVLIPYVQRFAQVGLGAVGALTGAVVGGIAGVAIGAALGASSGYLGRPAHHAAILHPMQHVAGAGAMPAHKGADKLLTRLAGEKAGAIAGKIAGTVVGLATGAAIGALGVAWAGIDVGARLGAKASETLFGAPPACDRSSDKKTYEQGILKKQIPEPTGEINPDSHHFYYINGAMEILRSDAQTNPQVARIYNFLSSDASYHN
ncbi:MAG: hypothetical protein FJX76_26015, partial [Armatimonadetes bacterium]|nr:hypothetical protein [Armatimonadota bacterium]